MEEQNLFADSRSNISSYRQLSSEYVNDFVKDWDNQLTILSTIAETQPRTAYLAFRF